jgi:predicted dehydrogenase
MIQWGIIGAGNIARVFCNGLRFSHTGQIAAVASRDGAKARQFAHDFSVPRAYDSYEALLADDAIDAVYIGTIHPAHLENVIQAAAAGKHILVEKPMGMNSREVQAMIDAARTNDVFLMEAFMYRCHPQLARMVGLIGDGAIGEVQVIRSTFGYGGRFNPQSRAFAVELGGGGIMDVGCYPASAARLVAGAAVGQPFLDPVTVKATGVVGPTGVDHYTAAVLAFDHNIIAQISTAVTCNLGSELIVHGTEGVLRLPNPWLPSSPCRPAKLPIPLDTPIPPSTIELTRGGQTETIVVEADRDLFTYEADMVAAHIAQRQAPAMSWADSLGNMGVLDRWRAEIGVVYPQD